MGTTNLALNRHLLLPFLLSVPQLLPNGLKKDGPTPVLIFLHGYMEGSPTEIFAGLTAHGPLSPNSSPLATSDFIIAAPQLPTRGDLWGSYADVVRDIARYVHAVSGGDPLRTYLSGFSYGGNGVFDIALQYPSVWTALWPVDPTRVPVSDPGLPIWLSSGAASRPNALGFIERLHVRALGTGDDARVSLDEGRDHVGTATSAYRSDSIYRWLLSRPQVTHPR
jgi:hypothetical protein